MQIGQKGLSQAGTTGGAQPPVDAKTQAMIDKLLNSFSQKAGPNLPASGKAGAVMPPLAGMANAKAPAKMPMSRMPDQAMPMAEKVPLPSAMPMPPMGAMPEAKGMQMMPMAEKAPLPSAMPVPMSMPSPEKAMPMMQSGDAGGAPVARFYLVDAKTDTRIMEIKPGATIPLSMVKSGEYSIQADPMMDGAKSAVIRVNDYQRTEYVYPFTSFGNVKEDYWGKEAEDGDQDVSVTFRDGSGKALGTGKISFSFTEDEMPEKGDSDKAMPGKSEDHDHEDHQAHGHAMHQMAKAKTRSEDEHMHHMATPEPRSRKRVHRHPGMHKAHKAHKAGHSQHMHGTGGLKEIYTRIEAATGFSMKAELKALIEEVYGSNKFSTDVERSAALTIGMQRISAYLYKGPMTSLIKSDDPAMHALGLEAMNASFHRKHTGHHAHGSDKGSFELMHILNPRKDHPGVKKYFKGNRLSAADGAMLRSELKAGKTLGDIFGKGGGMSADGILGQSLHPRGLVNLSRWSGFPISRHRARGSHKVSYQYQGFNSDNAKGAYLGMGKKGHGGSDRSHGTGRAKFRQAFDVDHFEAKLAYRPGMKGKAMMP